MSWKATLVESQIFSYDIYTKARLMYPHIGMTLTMLIITWTLLTQVMVKCA